MIDAVKARIAQIAPGLPQGVTLVPIYDRSDLVEQPVDTLGRALLEELAEATLCLALVHSHR